MIPSAGSAIRKKELQPRSLAQSRTSYWQRRHCCPWFPVAFAGQFVSLFLRLMPHPLQLVQHLRPAMSASESLYRVAEPRGQHVRMDWNALERRAESNMKRPREEVQSGIMSRQWTATSSRKYARAQHVNIQELRAVKAELFRAAVTQPTAGRQVVVVDSRVVPGAWANGRSSSKRLNALLRSTTSLSTCSPLKIVNIW